MFFADVLLADAEDLPSDAEGEDVCCVALQRLQAELRFNMHARERRRPRSASACAEFMQCRRQLVEWICDTVERLSLHRATFHAAINLLDRSLQNPGLARQGRYSLIAATCVRLASKHCEKETAVPLLSQLIAFDECSERYTEWDVAHMEVPLLTALDWAVHCSTAYDFLGALGLTSLIREGDAIGGFEVGRRHAQRSRDLELLLRRYSEFFIDLALYEFTHDAQPASLTAAAAVAAARVLFTVVPTWPRSLEADSGYTQPELNDTLCHLLDIFVHDFSDDWMRVQDQVLSIAPNAEWQAASGAKDLLAALEHGRRARNIAEKRSEQLSPTFVGDLLEPRGYF